MSKLLVNRREVEVKSTSDTPLLWVLRDELGLTGTKYGCGKAVCGACTVFIDDTLARSCVTPLSVVGERSVSTIEGLDSAAARAVQAAWVELEVAQCGYCQSGQILAATALLAKNPNPQKADIDRAMDGNICRCATYARIRKAIHHAAQMLS